MTLSHSPNIVRDGLVLYLDAANPKSYPGSGSTWYDLIGNNNGTINGSISFNSEGYFSFDGVDDFIELSSTHTFSKESSTMFFCINRPVSDRKTLFTYQANSYISHVEISSGSFITETRNNCNTFNNSGFSFSTNKWYIFCFSFNSNKAYWYVDGLSIGEATGYGYNNCDTNSNATELLDNLDIKFIGQNSAYSGKYNGSISSIIGYDVALSDKEVKQNFNALRGRYGI